MSRVQRVQLALLISLILAMPVYAAQGDNYEMLTISDTAVGITTGVCNLGGGVETGGLIQILDAAVYYTLHSPTATPSAGLGGFAPANTVINVPRASRFRAIRVAADARAYVVCLPN